MVRNYKRVSDRKKWTPASLAAAMAAVNSEGFSINQAATNHSIPRNTLKRYLRSAGSAAEQSLGRYQTLFTTEQEAELVAYIIEMEKRFYGVTPYEIRSLAFQLAERNGIPHPFSLVTQVAGKDWYQGFRKRHPELTLRTPEATSAARAQGFNRIVVEEFYDKLATILSSGSFPPSSIYNVDETSVLTVQTKKSKVLALRGRRQVGCITSAERGVLTTACVCASATGHYVPPMLIFPRQRITENLKKGAPPGTLFVCNSSAWMTTADFTTWFDHFVHATKPSQEHPILLLLDGHVSHTKNLAVIEKARKSYVTVLAIPPHCSHKLQPLDLSFMGPLKSHFSKSVEKFLKGNPGRVVTIKDISSLFGEAYMLAASTAVAANGFKKAGIVPFDRFLFSDADFAPADVTDVLNRSIDEEQDFRGFEDPQPPSSTQQISAPESATSSLPRQQPSGFVVSPEAINPLPKAKHRKIQGGNKKQKTVEITSDSYRNALIANQATRDINLVRQSKKRRLKPVSENAAKTKKSRKSEKENLDDSLCDICGSCFADSEAGEGWQKCSACNIWFHQCSHCCPVCSLAL